MAQKIKKIVIHMKKEKMLGVREGNLIMIISTSKSKNIREITKNGIEKVAPEELKGWNPHSKALLFVL